MASADRLPAMAAAYLGRKYHEDATSGQKHSGLVSAVLPNQKWWRNASASQKAAYGLGFASVPISIGTYLNYKRRHPSPPHEPMLPYAAGGGSLPGEPQ